MKENSDKKRIIKSKDEELKNILLNHKLQYSLLEDELRESENRSIRAENECKIECKENSNKDQLIINLEKDIMLIKEELINKDKIIENLNIGSFKVKDYSTDHYNEKDD